MQKYEEVFVKGTMWKLTSQNLDRLCEFYSEFDPTTLPIQSSIAARSYRSLTLEEQTDTRTLLDVIHFLKENKSIWSLIPEDMSLAKILLIMPATNATSEHAFSALKRVKTYFWTTMSSNRLNHLMTCTVHKELVNILSLN